MSSDNFLQSFWRNSFGSDELDHYTAEYTWLANQMAHAMMGFCLMACYTLFVFNFKQRMAAERKTLQALDEKARARGEVQQAADSEAAVREAIVAAEVRTGTVNSAHRDSAEAARESARTKQPERVQAEAEAAALRQVIASRGWFSRFLDRTPTDVLMSFPFLLLVLKELVDITSDYFQFNASRLPVRYVNPLLDSVTDLLFWYAGMWLSLFVASFYFDQQRYRLPGAVLGFVLCLLAGYVWLGDYWLNQKKTFDRSGLPLNYQRLIKLTNDWDDTEKYSTHPFANDRLDVQYDLLKEMQGIAAGDPGSARAHIVVSGGLPAERSRLAVSLGCEFAFRLRFDEWRPVENERKKVLYTTVVQSLDYPEGLLANNKSSLKCVIVDDLDVTIDPPIELLTNATAVFPDLVHYYSDPIRRRIARGANVRSVSQDTKRTLATAGFVRERDPQDKRDSDLQYDALYPPVTGPSIPLATPRQNQLDAINEAVQGALTEREQKDEQKRLKVFNEIRRLLTEENGQICTIWVLSNTGEGRSGPDEITDRQFRNREKWLYLIAYLTGQTREKLEKRRIELVRPSIPLGSSP
jgi:hypothetical protein